MNDQHHRLAGVGGPCWRARDDAEALVRPSTLTDVPDIQRIYAHHVSSGTGSFEECPPDAEEMARRRNGIIAAGLPYLVAEAASGVCGFAYAAPFRPRSAYRFTVEDSVYVAPEAVGLGIGQALLIELMRICARQGYRQMVAVIGDSRNDRSIRLHRGVGFRDAGVLESVGRKFDHWLDVVFMQCSLSADSEQTSA